MSERSLSAASAVSLLFLLAASAFVWIEFGEFVVSMIRGMAGG